MPARSISRRPGRVPIRKRSHLLGSGSDASSPSVDSPTSAIAAEMKTSRATRSLVAATWLTGTPA
jgi:hypothetical protein